MLRLFCGYRLASTVSNLRMIHDNQLIYTVDMLKERANGYLADNDTAQASEKSFQASKLALMNYVKRLEETADVEIVPKHLDNPWSYKIFNKLCRLIVEKADRDVAGDIVAGWKSAYEFHVKGWTQNDLSVEDVKFSLPFVLRFIDIVDKELNLNLEVATYVKENLFTIDIDEIASEIYEESNNGKVTQLLQNLKMRKDLLVQLNALYKQKYGEDLVDVLVRNKDEFKKFLGIKVIFRMNVDDYFKRSMLTHYNTTVTKTGKFLNSLVGALFVIHFTWSCAYSLQPTEETSAFFQQLDIFSYINFNKVVYQTVSLTDLTETGSKFLIFLSLLLNNFVMFFVIVFCSAKIYLKLHSHKYETNHSVTNVQSHGKVFRILLIQTIIPVIAFMAPLTACTYYVIAKIQSGIYGNFFMASAYPFFGVCYPLSTLVLVKTYSNYIKSKIFKSSPASVKVSTIVDRLNSHNNL